MREFLEKHYTEELAANESECIKLTLKALLEVVQSGGKNMEVAVMRRNKPLQVSAISTLLLIFQLLVVSTDPLPLIEIFILKQISFCFYHLMFTVDYTTVKKEFFPCTTYTVQSA